MSEAIDLRSISPEKARVRVADIFRRLNAGSQCLIRCQPEPGHLREDLERSFPRQLQWEELSRDAQEVVVRLTRRDDSDRDLPALSSAIYHDHQEIFVLLDDIVEQAAAEDIEPLRHSLERLKEQLTAHFVIEEQHMFPAMISRFGVTAESVEALIQEHRQGMATVQLVGKLLGEMCQSGSEQGMVCQAARSLRRFVVNHLQQEEELMLSFIDTSLLADGWVSRLGQPYDMD